MEQTQHEPIFDQTDVGQYSRMETATATVAFQTIILHAAN